MKVLVVLEPVDGRKGIDGRAQPFREKLKEDPFSGCLLLFRNRVGTTRILFVYDGQGLWLARKLLSRGRFLGWPSG